MISPLSNQSSRWPRENTIWPAAIPADRLMKPSQSSRVPCLISLRGSENQQPMTAAAATGTSIQKPQRQPNDSAISPANMGPRDGPIMLDMPKIDITVTCWERGELSSRRVCPSGTSGAPAAPCRMRQKISSSSEFEAPHMKVEMPKNSAAAIITSRWPKRSASHPVAGVATAVATMLKVITQDTSSWVADIAPCSCGSNADEISTEPA